MAKTCQSCSQDHSKHHCCYQLLQDWMECLIKGMLLKQISVYNRDKSKLLWVHLHRHYAGFFPVLYMPMWFHLHYTSRREIDTAGAFYISTAHLHRSLSILLSNSSLVLPTPKSASNASSTKARSTTRLYIISLLI